MKSLVKCERFLDFKLVYCDLCGLFGFTPHHHVHLAKQGFGLGLPGRQSPMDNKRDVPSEYSHKPLKLPASFRYGSVISIIYCNDSGRNCCVFVRLR